MLGMTLTKTNAVIMTLKISLLKECVVHVKEESLMITIVVLTPTMDSETNMVTHVNGTMKINTHAAIMIPRNSNLVLCAAVAKEVAMTQKGMTGTGSILLRMRNVSENFHIRDTTW